VHGQVTVETAHLQCAPRFELWRREQQAAPAQLRACLDQDAERGRIDELDLRHLDHDPARLLRQSSVERGTKLLGVVEIELACEMQHDSAVDVLDAAYGRLAKRRDGVVRHGSIEAPTQPLVQREPRTYSRAERRMETPITHDATAARAHDHALRIYAVSLLGPATVAGGLIWAILQPYRVTLLHPRGQGLWWLVFEPPLFVVLIGALFTVFVARPVLADLEQADAATR